jgi:two-component system, OmpR family, response regulator
VTCVLLIDDDTGLTDLLSEYLAEEGFEPHAVADGRTGVAEAVSGRYAIVMLDIMMPGMNGIDVLRRIRRESQVPVLMLTGRGDDVDRISGLDLGADDYVSKPCSPGEIVARLRAILRRTDRTQGGAADVLEAGTLMLDPGQRRATLQGRELDLTGTEFNLLEVLARSAGQLVSRENLSLQGLGRKLAPYDRSIDVHVSAIRQKLGRGTKGETWIVSVRGCGYQFVPSH